MRRAIGETWATIAMQRRADSLDAFADGNEGMGIFHAGLARQCWRIAFETVGAVPMIMDGAIRSAWP